MDLLKYPRTPHIQGSLLQPGDEDLAAVPFNSLAGRHLVVEEKIDGANSAVIWPAPRWKKTLIRPKFFPEAQDKGQSPPEVLPKVGWA